MPWKISTQLAKQFKQLSTQRPIWQQASQALLIVGLLLAGGCASSAVTADDAPPTSSPSATAPTTSQTTDQPVAPPATTPTPVIPVAPQPSITLFKAGQPSLTLATIGFAPADKGKMQAFQRTVGAAMKKIIGQPVTWLPANKIKEATPPPAITLELQTLHDAQGQALPAESFRLQTIDDSRLVITSGTIEGLRYGFYDWLERLGARFWSWDEQELPQLEAIVIPTMDYTWVPSFRVHDIMSKEAQTTQNDFAYQSRSTSRLQYTEHHTLYKLLTPYAKEHPEIYPLIQTKDKKTGKVIKEERKPNQIHFCYSDPHIAQALADAISKEVQRRHGNVKDYIYMAGMGDWYGGVCMCDRCQAIYKEEQTFNKEGKAITNGYSGTLLRMINKTAEILEAKYPGIQVGTMAYMSLEMPPAKTVPAHNVVIEMPRIRHCGVHPVDDVHDSPNAGYWKGLQQWAKLAPGRVSVWDYGTSFDNFFNPYPVLRSMAANIKAYHRIGVTGLIIQGNYVSMGGHETVMDNWVWSHLIADPSQDVDALIKTFTDGYYGPAASQVRAYIDTLEASVNTPKVIHANEFTKPDKSYLTDEVLTKLKATLAQARQAVQTNDDPKYLRRVNELAIGVDATEMWTQGKLIPNEKGDRLIRADIGDSYDRAKLMEASSRGASPREWGTGRAYWLDFLSWHGGPMATLTNDDLTVRVVPSQAGGFGPVTLAGKGLIQRSYVNNVRTGEFVGSPTSSQATTTADGDVSMWGPDTKRVFHQQITVVDPHTISEQVSAKWVSRDKQYADASVSIQTIIATDHSQIFYQDDQGQWHHFTEKLTSTRQATSLGKVTAWRIKRPGGILEDHYKPLHIQPGEKGNLPTTHGSIGLAKNKRQIILTISVPIRDLPKNGMTPCLERTLTITPPPTPPATTPATSPASATHAESESDEAPVALPTEDADPAPGIDHAPAE